MLGWENIRNVIHKIQSNHEAHQSTSQDPASEKLRLKQIIANETVPALPENPFLGDTLNFSSPQANIFSVTTYGGPGSKYQEINEDSLFSGVSMQGDLFAGVIDGSGGSRHGYLGGKRANESLAQALYSGHNIKKSFALADQYVMRHARGGYATGVVAIVDDNHQVSLGCKGDAKAMTIRGGQKLNDGTTVMHSKVMRQIESGLLPPHAVHTAKHKNIISSIIGNKKKPLFESKFQGQLGDQIVMGTDGLWDVVSEYEILTLSSQVSGKDLQTCVYELAYKRNNAQKPYKIQFSPDQALDMPPSYIKGHVQGGDNITVLVIDLRA